MICLAVESRRPLALQEVSAVRNEIRSAIAPTDRDESAGCKRRSVRLEAVIDGPIGEVMIISWTQVTRLWTFATEASPPNTAWIARIRHALDQVRDPIEEPSSDGRAVYRPRMVARRLQVRERRRDLS